MVFRDLGLALNHHSLSPCSPSHSGLPLRALNKDNYSGNVSTNQLRLYMLPVKEEPLTAELRSDRAPITKPEVLSPPSTKRLRETVLHVFFKY